MNMVSKYIFKEFWNFLYGYNYYRLLPGGGLLPIKVYSPILSEIYAIQNIITFHKEDK